MSTRTYRVRTHTIDNHVDVSFHSTKESAWAQAKQAAPNMDHVAYELVEDRFKVLKGYYWFRGVHYNPTANEQHGPCPACDNKIHNLVCTIPDCKGPAHVPHYGSSMCKSGKRPHCTCDSCF